MTENRGWYLSSTSKIDPIYDDAIGIIHTMRQGIYRKRLERGVPWCLDNGVFTNKFTVDHWKDRMCQLKEFKDTCLFIVIPDVVGNCYLTIEQFAKYRIMVRDFPSAFVSQDGIIENKNKIPWDDFDCLFVGGSNEHKLGKEGRWIIEEAKKRDKWIHVGRVNSKKRILLFKEADSWDGTTLSFAPSGVTRIYNAVLEARKIRRQNEIHNFISVGDSVSKSV